MEIEDPYMSTPSVAAMFDVTADTVREWILSGKLPATKINRQWRVLRSDAVAFANVKYPK